MVKRVGVVGLGLIGGSIALRLKDYCEVVGVDSDLETVRYALDIGCIASHGDYNALKGCDIVFVAVPIDRTAQCVSDVFKAVGSSAVITDVASVKGMVADTIGMRLVGGHPMAGTEFSGIRAAKAHLFENAYYVLVPYAHTSLEDFALVEDIVRTLGAHPVRMTADEHDRQVAEVSHMPHLLAYALAAGVKLPTIAGGGFFDMTRIAHSDPTFWRKVFELNRGNTLTALGDLHARIERLENALRSEDYPLLEQLLAEGKQGRDSLETGKPYLDEYVLEADIRDEVGALERVGAILAKEGINVKSMAIVHSREGVGGALRLGFSSQSEFDNAKRLLGERGYL